MPIDVSALDRMMPAAIGHFWRARERAARKQRGRGASDQGNRSGVTAGKNLDAFTKMVRQIIIDNGVSDAAIRTNGRSNLTVPGFYRPTKNWDLLVIRAEQLLAAIEFKSQVGPSFGNNFNNRVEEAIGNATDLLTAFREGAFGESPKPFLGFFFVLEESDGSTTPVRFASPHFPAFPEFDSASYATRYEILCRKLVQEGLYDAAALVLTNSNTGNTRPYRMLSEFTSPKRFAAALAGRIAAVAAESQGH